MKSNENTKPFIKKFIDDGLYYIYDVNTNRIIEVKKSVHDIIDQYIDDNDNWLKTRKKENLKSIASREKFEEIRKASLEHGIFSSFKPKKVTLGVVNADGVRALHAKGLRQIVIEITRACPLKCAYCPTSGKYSKSKNFKIHMNRDTCIKAVDFFCKRSFNTEEPYITFYGGEPLLRFDLIKETVEYVKKKYAEKKFSFNLTTNAALLNKEILNFLIENDIYILVSLDGPEQINDRYRRYKNGKGTFKRIMKNLEFIKEHNKEYYSRRVSISSVLSPPFDKVDEIIDFFSTEKTLSEIKGNIMSNLVDISGTYFLENFGLDESYKEYKNVYNKFIERLKKAILDNNLRNLTIEKKQVFSILYNISRRQKRKLYDCVTPLGACHIGLRRVFVTTNGDFHICERANYNYKIGCIEKGFDYERIVYYYRKLKEVLEDCKNCWAINLCERCWAVMGNLEEFSGKRKENFCSMNKKIIEEAFKLYVQLLREDPDCLKIFKEMTIG